MRTFCDKIPLEMFVNVVSVAVRWAGAAVSRRPTEYDRERMAPIELRNVSKRHGPTMYCVWDVSLQVEDGGFVIFPRRSPARVA
jgi:hypothetical protein